jgi:hypothetical protein
MIGVPGERWQPRAFDRQARSPTCDNRSEAIRLRDITRRHWMTTERARTPELAELDATDQAALVRKGEVSALELVEAAITPSSTP